MNQKTIFSAAALVLAFVATSVQAAPLLSNAVALQPVSAIATTNYGAPYTTNKIIDQGGMSATYVSGVTAASAIDSYTINDYQQVWHGQYGVQTGNLVFDLGASYTLDRVFLFWTNGGSTNNIANFNIDVSNDSGFSSFVTAASFSNPSGAMNRVDFSSLVTGEFVRLSWTSLQGSYPGLGEFVAGGVAAAVPEPETYAMLLAGLGLMGVVARRRKAA